MQKIIIIIIVNRAVGGIVNAHIIVINIDHILAEKKNKPSKSRFTG